MADGQFIIGYTPGGEPIFSANSPGIPNTIPSYLYTLFQDDDDLQAFVAEYNNLTQQYVNWFNQVDLPIYTGPLIVDYFLDWVAQGLYGYKRPVGMSDDVFKRSLTWHFYKGDGKYFDVRWLKRRVMRFLDGTNGTDQGTATTYNVSVTFGIGYEVAINSNRVDITGAVYDGWVYSKQTFPNGLVQTVQRYGPPALVYGDECYDGNPPIVITNPTIVPVYNKWIINILIPFPNGPDFKAGVDSKGLELPFQLQFEVILH